MSIYSESKHLVANEGGLFLTLADGESVKVRLVGEPVVFYKAPYKEDGQIRMRYGWRLWNYEGKAQAYEGGVSILKQLIALDEDPDWGDPTGYDIRLSRKGNQLETEWTVTPLPNRSPLSPEQIAEVDAVDPKRVFKSIEGRETQYLSEIETQHGAEPTFKEKLDGSPFAPKKEDLDVSDFV